MRQGKRRPGITFIEFLVVLALLVLIAAVLRGFRQTSRGPHRRGECASRLRQVGLAAFQYEKDYVCMPNAQRNIYFYLKPYLGLSAGQTGSDAAPFTDETLTDIFRCPSDEYLPEQGRWNAMSYAPLVDSGYRDGDDDGTDDGNDPYCAWSYCRTGLDANNNGQVDDPEDLVWQPRNLMQTAPDTALITEFWAATNRLNLDDPYPAGYLLWSWGGDPKGIADDGASTGTGGTINWGGAAIAAGKPLKRLSDVGGYVFLSQFAYEAQDTGTPRDLTDLVHDGRINVLQSDGAVSSYLLNEITNKPPKDIPMWTRTAD